MERKIGSYRYSSRNYNTAKFKLETAIKMDENWETADV